MNSFFASDIKKLNLLYNRPQFSFVFLYGMQGSGKTHLVREFCQGKRTLFYSASEAISKRQLYFFWEQTVRSLQLSVPPAPFESWKQAFAFIGNASYSRRLVLVLDEFWQLDREDSDFCSALTQAVSHDFPTGRVFLILTCSSMNYAGQIMSEPVQPPFDGIHARAHVGTIPFSSCRSLFSHYSPVEQLLLYGVTGGLVRNLLLLDPEKSALHNLNQLFFTPGAPLFYAPLAMLHQELRETSTYNYLLEIMASGCTKLADIAEKAALGTNKCAKYLNTLISLGLIRKEFPVIGEVSKKVRYVFTNSMYAFWYRFIYPNYSLILSGEGEYLVEKLLLPELYSYLSPVFESVCAEYLESQGRTEQTPFRYQHAGSWWTGGTKREAFCRIPLIAVDETQAILGFCHCSEAPASADYLESLDMIPELCENLPRYSCIFSTSGFTKELTEKATRLKNVWLIDLEDMTAE